MINRLQTILKKESVLNGFFFLFLAYIIITRLIVFKELSHKAIDNDQVVMWSAAKHYSEGLVYDLRFYGQDYNTMLEALLAAPLIKAGMPVYYAVPASTQFLFLFPFLFTAFFLFVKKEKNAAIIVLMVLMSIPVGYEIMTSIPRGFVTGIFFSSFFIISIFKPTDSRFLILNFFMLGLGYMVNQNSVLISAPFACHLFFNYYRNRSFYISALIAMLLCLPFYLLLNYGFENNKPYILYASNNNFSINYFMDAVKNINDRFAHCVFFSDRKGWLIVPFLFSLGLFLFYKERKAFYAFMLFIAVIVISFFSSKVADGVVWPFYSYSRMYICLPMVFVLFIVITRNYFNRLLFPLLFVSLCFMVFKGITIKNKLAYHQQEKFWNHVHLNTLEQIKNSVLTYKKFAKQTQTDFLMILGPAWMDDEINYGGEALDEDFPKTFKPSFERRTWILNQERTSVHSSFLLYTADYNYDVFLKETNPDISIQRLDDYGLFLIKNNTLTTLNFIKRIQAKTDGF